MRRNVYSTCDSQLPTDKKFVAVNLLSEDTLYFVVEVKSKVNELFAQICKFLGLSQTELFGLAIRTDSFLFLDPTQKLCKYASKQWKLQNNGVDNSGKSLFGVHLRVQFYVDSYLFISDKVAKLLYYLQLRENVVNYGQALCEERAFLLASYALQADFGNFNPELHVGQYFNVHQYFASWVIEAMGLDYIVRHLPFLHREHKAMSKSEAQSMYIREASDASAAHNLHLYKLKNKTGTAEVWIGICTTGVEINSEEQRISSIHMNSHSSHTCAKQKTRISYFMWADIGKLYFDKKKFEIRSIGCPQRKFTYYANTEEMARHLLWLCKVTHQFQLMFHSKMKEVKRRESELSRKKFRESYICDDTYEVPLLARLNKKGSDYSKGASSSLDETSAQRVSVISNASSNTTSGIVSDKVQSLEDSDREDIDVEIMITSAPVISLESLALSEPIDHCVRNSPVTEADKHYNSVTNITMNCNTGLQNKQKSGNEVPSSANSIKSTSSDQSNTTVKSIVPLHTSVGQENNQKIVVINNKTFDDKQRKQMNRSSDALNHSDCSSASPGPGPGPGPSTQAPDISAKVRPQPDIAVRSVGLSRLSERSESMNHIYENIPYFSQFQDSKPKLSLKACPSLSSTLTPTTSTNTQRTATRIGISSLTRTHNKPTLSVFANTETNRAKTSTTAASEPNLHTSQLWSTNSYSPNRIQVRVNDELFQSPNVSPIHILPESQSEAIGVRYDPEGRTHSESCQVVRKHSNAINCRQLVKCSAPSAQPSFHQSLNNISMTSSHPLRLFASDISVNTDPNLHSQSQSLVIPPPPPQYANHNHKVVIKPESLAQLTASHKGNSYITQISPTGRPNPSITHSEQNGSISDLHQLREKSRDLNLPLITALFNDRSLMMVPKTVPGTRQRHFCTARDIRRYSCSSEIGADNPYEHISTLSSKPIVPKVSMADRPTSWHIEYHNSPNTYIWEQFPKQRLTSNQFRSTTADFIERLWAEHQLTT